MWWVISLSMMYQFLGGGAQNSKNLRLQQEERVRERERERERENGYLSSKGSDSKGYIGGKFKRYVKDQFKHRFFESPSANVNRRGRTTFFHSFQRFFQ